MALAAIHCRECPYIFASSQSAVLASFAAEGGWRMMGAGLMAAAVAGAGGGEASGTAAASGEAPMAGSTGAKTALSMEQQRQLLSSMYAAFWGLKLVLVVMVVCVLGFHGACCLFPNYVSSDAVDEVWCASSPVSADACISHPNARNRHMRMMDCHVGRRGCRRCWTCIEDYPHRRSYTE